MPSQPDPVRVRQAVAARARGESYRTIANRFDVSEGAVRNWLRNADRYVDEAPAPEPPAPPADVAPPSAATSDRVALLGELEAFAVELDGYGLDARASLVRRAIGTFRAPASVEIDDDADALTLVRALYRQTKDALDAEIAFGGPKQAQLIATLQKMLPTMKALEAAAAGDADAVVIQRSEINAARARVAARLEALAAGGLRCEDCGADLRMTEALRAAGVREDER